MSNNQENAFVNNIIFVVLMVLLAVGAFRNGADNFSVEDLMNKIQGNEEISTWRNDDFSIEDTSSIFDQTQGERVRQKIGYSTAIGFFNQRSLSGTELMELAKRPSTSSYFTRNSSQKLVFYPTTGSGEAAQQFMRDFTKLRTQLKQNGNIVFIPIETGLGMSERQIKTSSDRVYYNLRKECGKFCIIDTAGRTVTSLKSPDIGFKTYEVVEAVVNSL